MDPLARGRQCIWRLLLVFIPTHRRAHVRAPRPAGQVSIEERRLALSQLRHLKDVVGPSRPGRRPWQRCPMAAVVLLRARTSRGSQPIPLAVELPVASKYLAPWQEHPRDCTRFHTEEKEAQHKEEQRRASAS